LVDSRWLFPERALPLVSLHNRFFEEKYPTSRPLTSKELSLYDNGSYHSGWRFDLKTVTGVTLLNLLLDTNTPFSEPRIAIVAKGNFLTWPHVEKDGLLCLRQDVDTIDHNVGVNLSQELIELAKTLIENNIAEKTQSDFIAEFNSYWNRWCTRKRDSQQKVLMLAAPNPPSRVVYRGIFGSDIIICDTPKEGLRWAKDRFQKDMIKEDRFGPAAFIWLDFPLTPQEYPKCNADVATLAKRAGGKNFEILMNLVSRTADSMVSILGFDTGNGPAFAGLSLNDLSRSPGSKEKKDSKRFNGFRNTPSNQNIFRKRFFGSATKTKSIPVQRIDRAWIFERGSRGFDRRLDEVRVCLIGCGSLGAQAAQFMAQSGARSFVLIDPETLSWDNIARHLLGGRNTGMTKVKGLKRHLESHFPGMLEIQVESTNWQKVFADEGRQKLIIESDLVISTLGNWDAEAALNYAFNTTPGFPPVVYGWTEPFGIAGHALAVTGLGGCLACGMDSHGNFRPAVTKWKKPDYLKRPPACGETYQPYGVTDIAPLQAMIARLCTDVLTGKVIRSEHRTWIGDLSQLEEAGGELFKQVKNYYGEIEPGYRQIVRDWKVNRKCLLGH
jgi:sulfur-carrier protein adenylyltransferase/sulfurtransferase